MLTFEKLMAKFVASYDAEQSTMMGKRCLRYKGQFFTMMFEREDALIVKVPESRVLELIQEGIGREFNFTKKKFKEWAVIPKGYEDQYENLMLEALHYAKSKS